jgi:CDP-glucose 4,6-dehydratase
MLAQRLVERGEAYADGWNFGPEESDARPVRWIVEHLCQRIPGAQWQIDKQPQPHEANYLKLDSSKAKTALAWFPRWQLAQALEHTLAWHRGWRGGQDMAALTLQQIHAYEASSARPTDA